MFMETKVCSWGQQCMNVFSGVSWISQRGGPNLVTRYGIVYHVIYEKNHKYMPGGHGPVTPPKYTNECLSQP